MVKLVRLFRAIFGFLLSAQVCFLSQSRRDTAVSGEIVTVQPETSFVLLYGNLKLYTGQQQPWCAQFSLDWLQCNTDLTSQIEQCFDSDEPSMGYPYMLAATIPGCAKKPLLADFKISSRLAPGGASSAHIIQWQQVIQFDSFAVERSIDLNNEGTHRYKAATGDIAMALPSGTEEQQKAAPEDGAASSIESAFTSKAGSSMRGKSVHLFKAVKETAMPLVSMQAMPYWALGSTILLLISAIWWGRGRSKAAKSRNEDHKIYGATSSIKKRSIPSFSVLGDQKDTCSGSKCSSKPRPSTRDISGHQDSSSRADKGSARADPSASPSQKPSPQPATSDSMLQENTVWSRNQQGRLTKTLIDELEENGPGAIPLYTRQEQASTHRYVPYLDYASSFTACGDLNTAQAIGLEHRSGNFADFFLQDEQPSVDLESNDPHVHYPDRSAIYNALHAPGWRIVDIDWTFIFASQHYGTIIWGILIAIALAISHWLQSPNYRAFLNYDATISYTNLDGNKIPSAAAVLAPFGILIINLVFYECFVFRFQNKTITHALSTFVHFLLDAICSFVTVVFITEVTKYAAGRLRPDFLQSCQPTGGLSGQPAQLAFATASNPIVCSKDVVDSRKSFPSGHASASSVTMVYSIVYGIWAGYYRGHDASFMGVNRHTGWRGGRRVLREVGHGAYLVWNLAQFGFFWAVGVTRFTDNKHHISDVIGGWFLGTLVALIYALRAVAIHKYVALDNVL